MSEQENTYCPAVLSRQVVMHFGNLHIFDIDGFESLLLMATNDELYAKDDLLFDIRTGLFSYKNKDDQCDDYAESTKNIMNLVKAKAKICKQLGLSDAITLMMLVDLGGIDPHEAREIMKDPSKKFVESVLFSRELADKNYETVLTDSLMLGFIDQTPTSELKNLDILPLAMDDFYKMTLRADVASLLPRELRRQVISEDLCL